MGIERGLWVVLLLSLAIVAGCGPGPSTEDAGTDAAGSDAGEPMDSGPDDSGASSCIGIPTGCGTLMTEPTCRTVMGCAFSQCAGFAVECDRHPSETACMAAMGCAWSGTECTGRVRQCGTFPDNPSCEVQAGCTWSVRAQCRGTPVPCTSLPDSVCRAQPGCMIDGVDGGPHDAGPPDANCMGGGGGTTTLAIHTITGAMAGGTVDLGEVAVRAAGPCAGAAIEMTTDASGELSVDLPNDGAPWSITLARAGYSAVSIVDVTNIAFDGDVRLDPIGGPAAVGYPASGTVTGPVSIGSSVRVDTYDFDTTTAGAGGAWSSMFYLAPAPAPAPPLQFVALELDADGQAINFVASAEQSRTAAAVVALPMVLPTPAETAIETRITYHLPMGGIADFMGAVPAFGAEHALLDVPGNPFVLVGTTELETGATPGDVTLVVRHFAGALAANLTGFRMQSTAGIINVLVTDLSDHEVTIPAITALGVLGTSLGGIRARGEGADYDVLALHIGETDTEDPHWRVFADASDGSGAIAAVPQLPSSMSLADIGIVDASTSVLPLYIRMETGRAWSTEGLNRPVPQYAYAGGGNYATATVGDL